MKKIFSLFIMCLGINSSFCQDQISDVKAVVEKLFSSMKDSDEKGIRSCFSLHASLKSIVKDKEGNISAKSDDIIEFASFVSKQPKGAADERITIDVIKIDGEMALVWAPYQFFYKGKFSHCGVDAFILIKEKDEWKINSLIDTRRTNQCD